MRARRAAVAAAAIAAALPAAARAASVEVRGAGSPAVRYVAGPGERNDLTIAQIDDAWPAAFTVSDPGAAIAPGTGCVGVDAHLAVCSSVSGDMYHLQVALGDGDDVLRPGGFELIRANGGPGADHLSGGTWDDRLDGGGGADELRGGEGADVLADGDAEPGPDVLDGGPGDDEISYAGRSAPVTVDLADPGPDGAPGEGDVLTSFVHVTGGRAGDRLAGDAAANGIDGGGGADDIAGRAGDDRIRIAGAGDVDCGTGEETVRGVRRPAILDRSCETVARQVEDDDFTADVAPRAGGRFAVTCPELDGEPIPCGGSVVFTEAAGAGRRLGRGRLSRGGGRRVARVRLTATGRRLVRGGPVRAVVELRGDLEHLAWTTELR